MAGLSPDNIRLDQDAPPPLPPGIMVDIEDVPDDDIKISKAGAVVEIRHGDGTVSVSLDGHSLDSSAPDRASGWFDNLCDRIGPSELSAIADDLLRGIAEDESSRKQWVEARATGIQLLGLQIEIPGLQGATDGAPVEGMSKIRHSLLLESVLRFQANARSELLPTDGPVKVRNDATGGPDNDALANALETDLNHYLTAVATEYVPDTDRMLFMLGFGGMAFKKVYFCPLRMRPVSETVDAIDLIVNNTATDLGNAQRVTHRVMMRPSTVRRLQILDVYRDITLTDPSPPQTDAAKRAAADQQGVEPSTMRPEDREREIYECYCELDIPGFEHKFKGKVSGLPVPYRVTIDVTSREPLAIVRNYKKPDPAAKGAEALPRAKEVFVDYVYVPGLGFYPIGLLHILGNTTNALTAAVREMLDNGMFANFPGFLQSKMGSRQNTNILRVPPGGAAQVDTQGEDIRKSVMPLPYNTAQMPPLMALVQQMAQDGQRLGGTSEMQVGEGRPDAPVGTTLALIDQATKIENSVHKRAHASQSKEFALLVECFREHPESFIQCDCPSGHPWTEATFLQALNDCDLVPQADPNTSSHGQRMMKIQALNMWAQANASLADPIAIAKTTIRGLGFSNPEQFMAPPQAMSRPPPELLEAQAKAESQKTTADAAMVQAQARKAEVDAKTASGAFAPKPGGLSTGAPPQTDTPVDIEEAKTSAFKAQTDRMALDLERQKLATDGQHQDADRQADAQQHALDLAKEVLLHKSTVAADKDTAKEAGKAAIATAKARPKGKPS